MNKDSELGRSNGGESVFARLRARLEADDVTRSLWQKMQEEMTAGGVSSVDSYLRGRFAELSARIKTEVSRMSEG